MYRVDCCYGSIQLLLLAQPSESPPSPSPFHRLLQLRSTTKFSSLRCLGNRFISVKYSCETVARTTGTLCFTNRATKSHEILKFAYLQKDTKELKNG